MHQDKIPRKDLSVQKEMVYKENKMDRDTKITIFSDRLFKKNKLFPKINGD